MRKVILLFITLLVLLSSAACGAESEEYEIREMGIAASNFPAYDFARAVAGDRLPVRLLVPPGSASHSYEPSAKDIIMLENWLLICNGGESEAWVEEILEGEKTAYEPLYMMDCVSVVAEEVKEGMQQLSHGHEHDENCEHGHGDEMEYDEHVWTSPRNAVLICRAICERLCAIDPAGEEYYRENLEEYAAELEALDKDIRDTVDKAEHHTLIFADRFPVRYFVEEYGLDYYAAFPGCAGEAEPSARTVAYLIDRVREENIPAVLYIEFSNEKMADIICEDTGCGKLLFHSCHNVSADDFASGIGYIDIMRNNLESLKEALG